MTKHNISDHVTMKDEEGNEKLYRVDALFDLDEQRYALLTAKGELIPMQVIGDELIEIDDQNLSESIIHAYRMAVKETTKQNIK